MKKALSLLLAVLMLVSLFSGMAYADDDVIVEEPVAEEVAEEPVVEEPVVEEDSFEAADAFTEEYTEEGSFEAADIQTFTDFLASLIEAGWDIERMDPAEPECGTIVKVWVHNGDEHVATPREVLFDHIWADPFDLDWPESDDAAIMDPADPDAIKPGAGYGDPTNGWKLVSSTTTSCEEAGTLIYQRVCLNDPEHVETQEVQIQGGNHVWATDPFSYAFLNGFDDDSRVDDEGNPVHVATPTNIDELYDKNAKPTTPADNRAILVMPTATQNGLGHEVCQICGTLNPNTADYVIPAHTESDTPLSDFHLYSEWRTKVPATCSLPGYEEKVCNIVGCQGSKNRPIAAWEHSDPDGNNLMKFTGEVVRVSCVQYVEVWECTNPLCCTTVKNGMQVSTYPEASQYVGYVGKDGAVYDTLAEAEYVAEYSDAYATYTDLMDTRNEAYTAAIDSLKENKDVDAFNAAIEAADTAFEAGVAGIVDEEFFWFTDPEGKATEKFEHHKFETDYTAVLAPGCGTPGVEARACSECEGIFVRTTPALEPIFGTKVFMATYTDIKGNEGDYHYVKCTRPECVAEEQLDPDFLKPDLATLTDLYPTQKDNLNPQTKIVDHDWSDWIVELPPQGANRGHWYRTCMYPGCRGREDFFGTEEEFEKMIGGQHPVLKSGLIPEIEDGVAVYKLYEMGMFKEDFTGMYEQDGGLFFVEDGYLRQDANGATLVDDVWYYLAGGEVQFVNTLAEYDTEWFLVEDGVIDIEKSALVEYNGGLFVVAEGRKVKEYSGLWQNAKSIGGEDEWYYVANGEVQKDYTGITVYDGHWFYLENGKLIPDYTGTVEYDGEEFEFVNGQLVA